MKMVTPVLVLAAAMIGGEVASETVLHDRVLGQAQITPQSIDIGAWIEKAGVLGFSAWMLLYFQRKTDENNKKVYDTQAQLFQIADRAITVSEKMSSERAAADHALADAVRGIGSLGEAAVELAKAVDAIHGRFHQAQQEARHERGGNRG